MPKASWNEVQILQILWKSHKRDTPLRGVYIPHFGQIWVKKFNFWGPTPLSLHRWGEIWHVWSLRGEKPQNRPLSKLNTGRLHFAGNKHTQTDAAENIHLASLCYVRRSVKKQKHKKRKQQTTHTHRTNISKVTDWKVTPYHLMCQVFVLTLLVLSLTVAHGLITYQCMCNTVIPRISIVFVSDIAVFVLKRDVKLQLTN